jgi:hypothetical protein
VHLTPALISKPVALLTATELKKWRDGLLTKIAPATVNRLCACLSAALEQAALHDRRIQNRDAWEIGLAGLPNAQQARNVILSDDTVREFVATVLAARQALRNVLRFEECQDRLVVAVIEIVGLGEALVHGLP